MAKPKWSLLPMEGLDDMAKLVTFMAEVKGDATWRGSAPQPFSEQYDSISRHLQKWWLHETNDPETNANHLTAVAFRALCVVSQQTKYAPYTRNLDDRPWKRQGNFLVPKE